MGKINFMRAFSYVTEIFLMVASMYQMLVLDNFIAAAFALVFAMFTGLSRKLEDIKYRMDDSVC